MIVIKPFGMASLVVGLLLAASVPLSAQAQAYPNKAIRLVVPFAPGGSSSIVARAVGAEMSKELGQQIIIDNKPGGGGNVAMLEVARADPDGHTLIIGHIGTLAVNPYMFARLPFDTDKDFVPISLLAKIPNIFVVNASVPVKDLREFIALARAKPGQLNFSSAGIGSGTHFNLEKLKLMVGIEVTHVPYKGTPEAIADTIAGRVCCYFAPINAALPHIKGGRAVALAVSSAKRSSLLPDVPTIAESGVPKFDYTLWIGLWGPPGMPADVVDKINKDVNRALASSDLNDRLVSLGTLPMSMSSAEFTQFIRAEVEDTARVLKAAGIKPQ